MGRRSINTTKSGKYMNPTDQARKEARKKELKKNKKQRQMVRAAVLKGKDPQQIILDLEKIDQMEYNVLQPSPLNEKVLKDKRKKLKDTLDRVLKMYNKDDPDKWAELKRLQNEYDRKRSALFSYYEAVRNAQQVQIDDIPLPINSIPAELQAIYPGMPSQIPLPTLAPPMNLAFRAPQLLPPPPSILKKTSAYLAKEAKKEPPGVPPGPPPSLDEFEEEIPVEYIIPGLDVILPSSKKSIRFADDEGLKDVDERIRDQVVTVAEKEVDEEQEEDEPIDEDEDSDQEPIIRKVEEDVSQRPTSLQQRMLAMAGQDIDQFMKEMEQVHKKRRADRAADLESRLQAIDDKRGNFEKPMVTPAASSDSRPPISVPSGPTPGVTGPTPAPEPPLIPPGPVPQNPGILPGLPPMMFRPPPPRGVPSLMGIRLPPGPPPGLPPRLGLRLPPGPPPGLPPRLMRPPTLPATAPPPAQPTTNVLSAGPQLISRPADGPTIQAQAQIRNLSAEVTRFIPSALRVKRDDKGKSRQKSTLLQEAMKDAPQIMVKPTQTKDDAYQQFMKEMEGLL